jgi:hypothetical protein
MALNNKLAAAFLAVSAAVANAGVVQVTFNGRVGQVPAGAASTSLVSGAPFTALITVNDQAIDIDEFEAFGSYEDAAVTMTFTSPGVSISTNSFNTYVLDEFPLMNSDPDSLIFNADNQGNFITTGFGTLTPRILEFSLTGDQLSSDSLAPALGSIGDFETREAYIRLFQGNTILGDVPLIIDSVTIPSPGSVALPIGVGALACRRRRQAADAPSCAQAPQTKPEPVI